MADVDIKLWGVGTVKFFCMMCIYEMAVIFFITADANISFLSTLKKPETETWGEVLIWNFSVWCIFTKW